LPHDQNNGVLMIDPDDYAVKDVTDSDDTDQIIVKCMPSGKQDQETAKECQIRCLNIDDYQSDNSSSLCESDEE
jgi:hypothetical protein